MITDHTIRHKKILANFQVNLRKQNTKSASSKLFGFKLHFFFWCSNCGLDKCILQTAFKLSSFTRKNVYFLLKIRISTHLLADCMFPCFLIFLVLWLSGSSFLLGATVACFTENVLSFQNDHLWKALRQIICLHFCTSEKKSCFGRLSMLDCIVLMTRKHQLIAKKFIISPGWLPAWSRWLQGLQFSPRPWELLVELPQSILHQPRMPTAGKSLTGWRVSPLTTTQATLTWWSTTSTRLVSSVKTVSWKNWSAWGSPKRRSARRSMASWRSLSLALTFWKLPFLCKEMTDPLKWSLVIVLSILITELLARVASDTGTQWLHRMNFGWSSNTIL